MGRAAYDLLRVHCEQHLAGRNRARLAPHPADTGRRPRQRRASEPAHPVQLPDPAVSARPEPGAASLRHTARRDPPATGRSTP